MVALAGPARRATEPAPRRPTGGPADRGVCAGTAVEVELTVPHTARSGRARRLPVRGGLLASPAGLGADSRYGHGVAVAPDLGANVPNAVRSAG